ncbi:MAG: dihydrodipicolinate synthase family protein [Kiritimatiellae bacterium]|nr:dihydrodipicolinate synthase family protein [Kiritimatiellia bacterium]
MHSNITGLVAATFTPFHSDGAVDLSKIPAIVAHLKQSGCVGLYINGSTGEGPSLTIAERRQLAEAYLDAAHNRLTTIVQVGTNSTRESCELAAHAAQHGADAISATPPSYFKPEDAEALVGCVAEIAAGAPELPFYHYHIPTMTGVTVNMEDFLRCAGDRIPNLAGIKFCSSVMHEMRRCMTLEGGRFEMLNAWDEMLLSGLATGIVGAVGSTYNFAAPIYHNIIKAFNTGDMPTARLWQDRALEMLDRIFATCGRAGLKGMMSLIGLDCGPQRLPIPSTTPQKLVELKQQMESIGFFDWIQ